MSMSSLFKAAVKFIFLSLNVILDIHHTHSIIPSHLNYLSESNHSQTMHLYSHHHHTTPSSPSTKIELEKPDPRTYRTVKKKGCGKFLPGTRMPRATAIYSFRMWYTLL
jgi:hypothetical protein